MKTEPDDSTPDLKGGGPIVRREGDRAVIENVPRPMGINSVLACYTSILRSQGEDLSYAYVMGVSSRAFRLQFSWCPSAPHSFCGFNTFEPALKATGYEATRFPLAVWEPSTRKQRPATEAEVEAARKAVRESIDRGMPCLMDSEEAAPIIGYEPISEDNKTGWIVRFGFIGPEEAPYSVTWDALPWELRTLKRVDGPIPPRRESVLWSLRTAVQNARRAECEGYRMGFAAYEYWIRELSDPENPGIQLGNAWCYESLIDARKCAAEYLRDISDLFGGDAAKSLRCAADAYDRVHDALTRGADDSGTIAPYPWDEEGKWPQEKRNGQAARLEDALAHEQKGIAEIEKALADV